jgi:uncharacterized protein (TIGR03435 family)
VPPAQNVFEAVRDQLGLRSSRRALRASFIVIDRIERPSPN